MMLTFKSVCKCVCMCVCVRKHTHIQILTHTRTHIYKTGLFDKPLATETYTDISLFPVVTLQNAEIWDAIKNKLDHYLSIISLYYYYITSQGVHFGLCQVCFDDYYCKALSIINLIQQIKRYEYKIMCSRTPLWIEHVIKWVEFEFEMQNICICTTTIIVVLSMISYSTTCRNEYRILCALEQHCRVSHSVS